jgi:hypothetical protein
MSNSFLPRSARLRGVRVGVRARGPRELLLELPEAEVQGVEAVGAEAGPPNSS